MPKWLFENAAQAIEMVFSFFLRVFTWITLQITSAARWSYENTMVRGSSIKASSLSLTSRLARLTGISQLIAVLRVTDPYSLIFLQIGLLMSASALLLCASHRPLSIRLERGHGKMVLGVCLVAVALASLGILLLNFPPRYVINEVANLTDIPEEPVRPGHPIAFELDLAVPRRARILSGSFVLESSFSRPPMALLAIENKSEDKGFPLTKDFSTAFGFDPGSTNALKGFSLLLSEVSGSRGELTITGFLDQNGRPTGDPILNLSASPTNLGIEPQWIDFILPEPFLAFGDETIWLVVTVDKSGSYVWWASNDLDDRGTVLVQRREEGWSENPMDPCVKIIGEARYLNDILVETGRIRNYWSGVIPTGGQANVDVTRALEDYLPLSPENFKIVRVPLKLSSTSRAEVLINQLEIIVEEPNPNMPHALVSLGITVLVSSMCAYSVWKLFLQRDVAIASHEPSPVPHMRLSLSESSE